MGIGCRHCRVVGGPHDEGCPNHPSAVAAREESEDRISELEQELEEARDRVKKLEEGQRISLKRIEELHAMAYQAVNALEKTGCLTGSVSRVLRD